MFQNTQDYTKTWDTFCGFDTQGEPLFETEFEFVQIGKFDEYFLHYLSSYLPTLEIDPDSDGLELFEQFKDLYIQCRLDCQHEYRENGSTPP
jgi:hypothetical protein